MRSESEIDRRVVEFIATFLSPDVHARPGGAHALPMQHARLDHLEFEVRLCAPSNGCKTHAVTSISDSQWARMLAHVRLMRNRGVEEATSSIVCRYAQCNDNVTSMQTLIDDVPDGHAIVDPGSLSRKAFRMKRKLGTMDLQAIGTPFDLRLSACLELPTASLDPMTTPASERFLKRRWSFTVHGVLRIDFTKLDPIDDALVSMSSSSCHHQVEIEVAQTAIDKGIDPAQLWALIKRTVEMLAEAADGHRNHISYALLRQRLHTRVGPAKK